MTPLIACAICAPPLDTLLAGGLHAGVLVLGLVAGLVVALLARAGWRLMREEEAAAAE